jgi:ATP-dependent helicase/nuclease subunit A
MTAQHEAADPRRSAWVSANAGAGKTYTLANRVTRLLLDGAKPERILCLTYTKAAAAEMEARLFDQLGQWAMASDDELQRRIAEIGAGDREGEDLREARRLFALALETPGGLKIQTIHSFCQYLLARFPLEAGVAPSFRVLDDGTAKELRDEARAHVLARAGRGEAPLDSAVATLVTETSEMQLHSVLDAAFGGDRRKLERFLARVTEEDLPRTIRAAHGAGEDSAADIVAEFLAAMRREEALLREIAAWLGGGSKADQEASQRLVEAIEGESLDAFTELFLTGKGKPREKLATQGSINRRPDLFAALNRIADEFAAAEEHRRAAHAAALAEAAIILIRAARSEYEAAKRDRSMLDYDDLILTAERLLERREAAQWVLYKLDGGLDHVLIDEAQDTSPEQWAIVTRLTEEFFAGEGAKDSARPPRTIFAVGDEKQSIFSFQGAEPREFEIHRRHFAERIGRDAFADVRLDVSRRSVPEVLRFVDEVFAPHGAREGVVSTDDPISHRAHRDKDAGRVELWPLVEPTGKPEPDIWRRPVDEPSEASPVVQLAVQIAQRIKGWLDGKTRLPGKDHPIRPGDIMVLTPRREPFAGAFIRELKRLGIPVAGADRIRIANQIAVMDLVALGRFVLLPEDDLNLASLLRSPLVGFSEDELFALGAGRTGTLWQALQNARATGPRFAEAADFLSATFAAADYAPPHEFYAAILSEPQMRTRILTRLGVEASDAIDEFMSLALAYEALNTPSLEGFLHWIEHGDAEVKRDMERARDEVRVMTVHGSKGLEADIVILPDTAGAPGGSRPRMEILYTDDGPVFPVKNEIASARVRQAKAAEEEKSRQEHRRLLYVALTRARDRLYICGFKGPKALNDHSWYPLARRAAKEIGIEVLEHGKTVHALGEAPFERTAPRDERRAAQVTLPSWIGSDAPIERERPRLIRPSDAAGVDESAVQSPVGVQRAERFRRGNLVHALLARLPDMEPSGRHAAALRYLAAQGVAADAAAALIAETLAVIEGGEFAAAFSPGARAEVAIVADLPRIAEGARVNGRIDRLAVSEKEILAVDFKTNRPPPTRVEDVPTLYITQMTLYRAALMEIFPGRRVACALVWTDGPSLMRLEEALLDAELARISARLRAEA